MGKCTDFAEHESQELRVNAFQNQWSQQQREDEQRETSDGGTAAKNNVGHRALAPYQIELSSGPCCCHASRQLVLRVREQSMRMPPDWRPHAVESVRS